MATGNLEVIPEQTGYRPSDGQLREFVNILVQEGVFEPDPVESEHWVSGPNWIRLGIPSRSHPMWVSLTMWTPTDDQDCPGDPLAEVMKNWFSLSISECAGPDVDKSDPIWNRLERAIGCRLKFVFWSF